MNPPTTLPVTDVSTSPATPAADPSSTPEPLPSSSDVAPAAAAGPSAEPRASPEASASPSPVPPGTDKLAEDKTNPSADVGPVSGAAPSTSGEKGATPKTGGGGPLGSAGVKAGVGLALVLAIALVSVAAYKVYGILPDDSLRSVMRLSSHNGGSPSSPGSPPPPDESRFLRKWILPNELPESAVAAGEAAAAALGGTFAGFMRPGTEKVRPPQVITRTAQPEMLTALSDLRMVAGNMGSSSLASPTSGLSLSDGLASVDGVDGDAAVPGMMAPGALGAGRRPKVDLIVVMDASGAMSWQDYRTAKEFFTRAGGLLDNVMGMAEEGSRVAFVEYAYDSVVVSELDDDVDRVKRRVLGAFQGDANNWDRETLYIYEVDEKFGGNALRKVNSLKTRAERQSQAQARTERKENGLARMASEVGEWDEDEVSIANAAEVPPAMNGLSRDAHMALKWSRLEMLPPLANRELERKMERANRLRRILIVNAGEMTDGGVVDTGLEACLEQTQVCEERGIATIAVGIGNCQDAGLDTLATGDPAAFFSVREAEDLETIAEDLTHMILSPRFAPSSSNLVRQPQALFFKDKLRSRFGRSQKSSKSPSPNGSGKKRRLWRKSSGSPTGDSSDSLPDDDLDPSFKLKDPPPPSLDAGKIFVRSQSDLPPWFREQ